MTDPRPSARAAVARDAALRRLRHLTRGMIAGSVALVGVFAGLAASSTHARKVVRVVGRTTRSQPPSATPTAPTVSVQSPFEGDDGSTTTTTSPPATTTPATTPAPQAPAPTQAAPVVVTGGT